MQQKLIIIIALAVLWLQKPAGAQAVSTLDDPLRHGYALLIGNSHYEDRAWPPLNDIPLQLTALKKGLDKHFDRVEIVQDLKAEQIRQKINNFLRTYGNDSNARLLIYYAGHGYTEPIEQYSEYRGYITGTDTPKSDYSPASFAAARLKAISMIEIRAPLPEVLARHILFIFDSCFAGSIFTDRGIDPPRTLTADMVARLHEKPSRDFITAGTANETVPAHSPIPDLLLAALAGEADRDGLGVVSATEIHTYLRNKLLRMPDVNLTPQAGRLRDSRFAAGEFLFRVGPAAKETIPVNIPPAQVKPRVTPLVGEVLGSWTLEILGGRFPRLTFENVFELMCGRKSISLELAYPGTVSIGNPNNDAKITISAQKKQLKLVGPLRNPSGEEENVQLSIDYFNSSQLPTLLAILTSGDTFTVSNDTSSYTVRSSQKKDLITAFRNSCNG